MLQCQCCWTVGLGLAPIYKVHAIQRGLVVFVTAGQVVADVFCKYAALDDGLKYHFVGASYALEPVHNLRLVIHESKDRINRLTG